MRAEGDGQREGTAKLGQGGLHRFLRAHAYLDAFRNEVGDHFAVGLALEHPAARGHGVAQRLEILDDAVVDQSHLAGGVGMGVGGGRRAVGGPAGVGDAGGAGRCISLQFEHEVHQLARCAAADQFTAMDGADPGAVIAAVFHAPQAIDQTVRNLILADDTDDAAHGRFSFARGCRERGYPASLPENPWYFV